MKKLNNNPPHLVERHLDQCSLPKISEEKWLRGTNKNNLNYLIDTTELTHQHKSTFFESFF